MGMRPGWVGGLVEESFFVGCAAHENRKKNEKNIFCLGCCASICPHCAPAHRHHPLLQVTTVDLHSTSSLPCSARARPVQKFSLSLSQLSGFSWPGAGAGCRQQC
jgi:hypothetical protein